jgi:hypothetical protein
MQTITIKTWKQSGSLVKDEAANLLSYKEEELLKYLLALYNRYTHSYLTIREESYAFSDYSIFNISYTGDIKSALTLAVIELNFDADCDDTIKPSKIVPSLLEDIKSKTIPEDLEELLFGEELEEKIEINTDYSDYINRKLGSSCVCVDFEEEDEEIEILSPEDNQAIAKIINRFLV